MNNIQPTPIIQCQQVAARPRRLCYSITASSFAERFLMKAVVTSEADLIGQTGYSMPALLIYDIDERLQTKMLWRPVTFSSMPTNVLEQIEGVVYTQLRQLFALGADAFKIDVVRV